HHGRPRASDRRRISRHRHRGDQLPREGAGMKGAEILAGLGLKSEPAPDRSELRFPDGAHFRVELPSIEGPAVLMAAVEAADKAGVTINRVSQGSGAMLLTRAELAEMARIGADRGLE